MADKKDDTKAPGMADNKLPLDTPQAAAAPAAAPAAMPDKKVAGLARDRWQFSDFVNARHSVTPEADTPYANLLKPEYWAHIANKLKPGDIIEARAEDGSYFAEIYVWNRGQNWAQVQEIRKLERPAFGNIAATPDDYMIEWRGSVKKHRIVRRADQSEVKSGFDTPEAAAAWLRDHKRALAA